MNATLVAHKGTNRVTEAIVRAEPRPQFTDSWHPFSHGEVIDAVALAVQDAGFKVERKEYSISPGALMFGTWELNKQDGELRYAIGLRNSLNKKMSVGLCAGERVFVCDNMVFSSEFVLFRKHTGMLDQEELQIMAREALGFVVPQWDKVRAWHNAMKDVELNAAQVSVLTFAAMRQTLIAPSKFAEFNALYYGAEDVRAKYTPTLHGWHGVATELMNGMAIHVNAAKQAQLNAFIDHEVPLLMTASADKKFFTFDKVEEKAADATAKAKEDRKEAGRAMAGTIRAKVTDARKAAKDAAKAEKKAAKPVKDKGSKKKADTVIKITDPKALALLEVAHGKKPRRTTRVKVREAMAKTEAKVPVKTKAVKPPKGEVVAKAKPIKPDPEDVFFCTDCAGEFSATEIKRDRGTKELDLVCPRCLEGRKEARKAGKAK